MAREKRTGEAVKAEKQRRKRQTLARPRVARNNVTLKIRDVVLSGNRKKKVTTKVGVVAGTNGVNESHPGSAATSARSSSARPTRIRRLHRRWQLCGHLPQTSHIWLTESPPSSLPSYYGKYTCKCRLVENNAMRKTPHSRRCLSSQST